VHDFALAGAARSGGVRCQLDDGEPLRPAPVCTGHFFCLMLTSELLDDFEFQITQATPNARWMTFTIRTWGLNATCGIGGRSVSGNHSSVAVKFIFSKAGEGLTPPDSNTNEWRRPSGAGPDTLGRDLHKRPHH